VGHLRKVVENQKGVGTFNPVGVLRMIFGFWDCEICPPLIQGGKKLLSSAEIVVALSSCGMLCLPENHG
jgi:hypothetical protein